MTLRLASCVTGSGCTKTASNSPWKTAPPSRAARFLVLGRWQSPAVSLLSLLFSRRCFEVHYSVVFHSSSPKILSSCPDNEGHLIIFQEQCLYFSCGSSKGLVGHIAPRRLSTPVVGQRLTAEECNEQGSRVERSCESGRI